MAYILTSHRSERVFYVAFYQFKARKGLTGQWSSYLLSQTRVQLTTIWSVSESIIRLVLYSTVRPALHF
jgi:hypothetical protein